MLSTLVATARELVVFLRSDRGSAALARGGIGSLVMKVLHAALTLAVAVLLARILGPAQFGVYTFAFAVVTVLAIPIQFGLPLLVVRETAAGRARSDPSAAQGIWFWSLRFVLFGSVIVVVAAAIPLVAGWDHLDSTLRWTFLWALPLAPLMALAALHGAALRGLDRVVIGQLPDHVMRLTVLAVVVSLTMAWSLEITAPRAMAMHVIAAFSALLAAHVLLRRFRGPTSYSGVIDRARAKRWMLATLPLGFIAAAQIINTRADTLLLGILADAESVGLYQVAIQGAQAVAMALGAISLVVAPRIAALHEEGQNECLQRLVTVSAQIVLLLTLPVVLVLIIVGGTLIRLLFGTEYQAAYLPLAILAAGQLVNAGFGIVGAVLNMTGHERATARGLTVAAGLNILLNLALIPTFGIVGAAMATAISLVVWNILLWRSSMRLLGINSLAIRWKGCAPQRT